MANSCTAGVGAVAVVLLLAGGCGGDTLVEFDSTGRIRILLTDAPADYLSVAEVCISQVYLQAEDGDDEAAEEDDRSSRVVLWEKLDGPAQCMDLLELQGISVMVADAEVPAGSYAQLRFIVESARVTLAEGYAFRDGGSTRELKVPSGARTGIKVQLMEQVLVEAQTLADVTVDADVNANFVIQGNPATPAGIRGVLFKPVLKQIPPTPP